MKMSASAQSTSARNCDTYMKFRHFVKRLLAVGVLDLLEVTST